MAEEARSDFLPAYSVWQTLFGEELRSGYPGRQNRHSVAQLKIGHFAVVLERDVTSSILVTNAGIVRW